MEITIPFNIWSRERLKKGKCATSRNSRYGIEGDTFMIDGVRYEITSIMKLPLLKIANQYWYEEGATSSKEFIEVWKGIHPIAGWKPDKEVWIHFFHKIEG